MKIYWRPHILYDSVSVSIIANMDNDNANKFEKDELYILCHFI